MKRLVLLTDPRFIRDAPSAYVQNILLEDRLLAAALKEAGVESERLSWDDPRVLTNPAHALVFRTTWDYFDRFEEFSHWLAQVSAKHRLINPSGLVRWNMDKHYLFDLQEAGVAVPPAIYTRPPAAAAGLEKALHMPWKEMVLKPAVSGAGRLTFRLTAGELAADRQRWLGFMQAESFLIQEFQEQVLTYGEVSLIFFNGQYSHAVRKQARPGEFRVQDDFGGTVAPWQPRQEETDMAFKALSCCPVPPVYARVDLVPSAGGVPLVQELELIEPELWIRFHPPSAGTFARSLLRALE
jgi:glutathione synthase/RimK-type ligase-like ATP-grasp enzyme